MKYSDLLKQAKEMNINIYSLMVAYTLESVLDHELCENDFDKVCNFIENIALKCDCVNLDDLCNTANRLLFESKISVEELLKMPKWDYLEQCYIY